MFIPEFKFFIFGVGARDKFLYREGKLSDALTGEVIFSEDVAQEVVNAPAYTVRFTTTKGEVVVIREDEHGILLERDDDVRCVSESPVNLPTFEGHPHEDTLRVLHHEILVNVMPQGPLPNFFAYAQPRYRDAAMMAMVLQKTDNVRLIRDWVEALSEPFDQLCGECELDNLGQALYLISLTHDCTHPLVPKIFATIPHYVHEDHSRGSYISGMTQGAPHPVYQTQWLKFGLRALGMDDPFIVPWLEDTYASLCWWADVVDYVGKPQGYHAKEEHLPCLTWAEAHFFDHPLLVDMTQHSYPLSWEAGVACADYAGMRRLDASFEEQKQCIPHGWHAAEMFLYLLDQEI